MIRITGGRWRGRALPSPPDKTGGPGAVRPTTALMRESLFSRFAERMSGARFLDAFAGSGIVGFEALSRGAAHVTALEHHRANARRLRLAAETLPVGDPEIYRVVLTDACRWLAKPCEGQPFDIAFLDPPYGFRALASVIEAIRDNGWLAESGLVIVELAKQDALPIGFDSRVFGDSVLAWLQV